MADYSYGALRIRVTADTSALEATVRRAATGAGQDAGKRAGEEIGKGLSRGASTGLSAVAGAARSVVSGVASAAGTAGSAISTGLSRAFAAASSAGSRAASAVSSAWGKLGEVAPGITSGLSRAFSAVSTAGSRAAAAVSSAWSRVGEASAPIVNGFGRAWSAVSSAGSRAAAAVSSGWSKVTEAAAPITSAFGRAFSAVSSAGARAAEAVGGAFAKVGQQAAGGGGGGGMGGLLGLVKNIGGAGKISAVGMGVLAGSVIKTGIGYNTLSQTSRAAFTTILGSAQAADKMMADIAAFAKTSPFPRQAFIEASQQMISFGVESRKVIPYLTNIQDAVAATGGNAQTLSEITLVMSQIQAAGKITGVDLMQFAQRGINAADLIGSAMGKTGTQIKEEITAGSLDATTALDALSTGMGKRFGGAAENVKNTWAGTTDRIKGAMRDMGSALVAPFIDPKGGGYAVEWGNKLATSLRGAIPAVTAVMGGVARVIGGLAGALNWVFTMLDRFQLTGPVVAGIMAMVIAFTLYKVAVAIATVTTSTFGAVLAFVTSPIGIVVLAIGALVAIVIYCYTHFAWFRTAVAVAWTGIQVAAQVAWSVLQAVFNAIVTAVGWVVGFIGANWPLLLGILTGPIGLAVVLIIRYWSQIQAVTSTVINWVLGAVNAVWSWLLAFTSSVWGGIRGAVTGAWNAILATSSTVLNWIRGAALAVWSWLLAFTSAVWGAVRGVITGAWSVILTASSVTLNWLRGAVSAVWSWALAITTQIWNAIRGVIMGTWTALVGFMSGVFAWFRSTLSGVWTWARDTTSALWNQISGAITGAWNGIKGATGAALDWIKSTMAAAWGAIAGTASSAWGGIRDGIGNVWNGVKEKVLAPVRFIVKDVINKLVGGINALITKIGMPAIPAIPGFAGGGMIPGGWGGGDSQLIMAEPGEWMLTKRQARAIGYARLRSLPHYAEGGQIGHPSHGPQLRGPFDFIRDLGGAAIRITHVDDLLKLGKDVVDTFGGMLKWAASEAFRAATTPLRKLAEPLAKEKVPPGNLFRQYTGKLAINIIDKAIEFIASKSAAQCDAGGVVAHAMQFDGKPYRWGGPANPSAGFDCSSFVSFIAGSAGLPLPGGFKVPSGTHGPVTTDYLRFSGMKTIGRDATRPGDVAVSPTHIGFIIGPGGAGFAARSTATGIGKQSFASGYTYRTWGGAAAGAGTCDGGTGPGGPPNGFPTGVKHYAGLVRTVCAQLGIPWATNAFLSQMASESNGNPRAINNWDSNAKAGTPSKGLMQVIDPTFAAYAGPHRGRGIWDPLANIYAAVNYAKSRYGSRLLSVIGRGHGYAAGGIISEPVVGVGLRSGEPYSIAERGRELVTPLRAGMTAAERAVVDSSGRGGNVINVYPQPGQSPEAIAAAVSRRLAWAQAGGQG